MAENTETLSYPKGRLFVFGDIHGCLDELQLVITTLKNKEGLTVDDQIVFIGDYIDRGPDSKGVVDFLIQLKKDYPQTLFLCGNHEDMFLAFLGYDGAGGDYWLPNGGVETLDSYGIVTREKLLNIFEELPKDHLEFYTSLRRMAVYEHYLLVHAGVNPKKDLLGQVNEDIYWIREKFIHDEHKIGKTIVFGHTPYQDLLFDPPYKLGIDTGLVYGNRLSCVDLTNGLAWQISRGDREVSKSLFKDFGFSVDDFLKAQPSNQAHAEIKITSTALKINVKEVELNLKAGLLDD